MKKKKPTKRPIDMTHYGAIIHPEQIYFCSLGRLLIEIMEKGRINTKSQKALVVVEKFGYDRRNQESHLYEFKKIFTVGYLRKLWENVKGQIQTQEEIREQIRWEMESYEKDAQRRSAWGAFAQIMEIKKGIKEEKDFNESIKYMSRDEQKEAIDLRERELSKRSHTLRIG